MMKYVFHIYVIVALLYFAVAAGVEFFQKNGVYAGFLTVGVIGLTLYYVSSIKEFKN